MINLSLFPSVFLLSVVPVQLWRRFRSEGSTGVCSGSPDAIHDATSQSMSTHTHTHTHRHTRTHTHTHTHTHAHTTYIPNLFPVCILRRYIFRPSSHIRRGHKRKQKCSV